MCVHIYAICPSFSSSVEIELGPRTFCVLGKCSAPELYLLPYVFFFPTVQSADMFFSVGCAHITCTMLEDKQERKPVAAGLLGGDPRPYCQCREYKAMEPEGEGKLRGGITRALSNEAVCFVFKS